MQSPLRYVRATLRTCQRGSVKCRESCLWRDGFFRAAAIYIPRKIFLNKIRENLKMYAVSRVDDVMRNRLSKHTMTWVIIRDIGTMSNSSRSIAYIQ